MKLWQRNLLLAVLAVGLVVIPLAFVQGAEWGGADTQTVDMIKEIRGDYEPWFQSLFAPEDMERYFFGLQALLGTAVLAAAMGWMIGRQQSRGASQGRELRIAGVVIAVAIAAAGALFFVRTEFGEIQALISALQGVCLGLLGFFAGHALGRRRTLPAGTA